MALKTSLIYSVSIITRRDVIVMPQPCCSNVLCTLHTMTSFINLIMYYLEECTSKDKTISKLQDVIHEERHKSETTDTVVDNLTSEVFRVWEIIDDTRSKLEAKTRLADELEREVKILQLKIEELELESRRLKDMVKDTQYMQGNGGQE